MILGYRAMQRLNFRLRGDWLRSATWHAEPLPGDWTATADVAYEAILIAINDQPVSLRFAASAYLRDDTRDLVAGLPDGAGVGLDGNRGHPDGVLLAARSPGVPEVAGIADARARRAAAGACCCRWRRPVARRRPTRTAANPPPVWLTDAGGARFRVRFDPGERLILGGGRRDAGGGLRRAWRRRRGSRSSSVCCCGASVPRRAGTCTGSETTRSRACACIPAAGTRGAAVDGALYRGLFLRQSREGTLTLP